MGDEWSGGLGCNSSMKCSGMYGGCSSFLCTFINIYFVYLLSNLVIPTMLLCRFSFAIFTRFPSFNIFYLLDSYTIIFVKMISSVQLLLDFIIFMVNLAANIFRCRYALGFIRNTRHSMHRYLMYSFFYKISVLKSLNTCYKFAFK